MQVSSSVRVFAPYYTVVRETNFFIKRRLLSPILAGFLGFSLPASLASLSTLKVERNLRSLVRSSVTAALPNLSNLTSDSCSTRSTLILQVRHIASPINLEKLTDHQHLKITQVPLLDPT